MGCHDDPFDRVRERREAAGASPEHVIADLEAGIVTAARKLSQRSMISLLANWANDNPAVLPETFIAAMMINGTEVKMTIKPRHASKKAKKGKR